MINRRAVQEFCIDLDTLLSESAQLAMAKDKIKSLESEIERLSASLPVGQEAVEPTDEVLRASFTFDVGGPNPYYKCNECGKSVPGLLTELTEHWHQHNPVAAPSHAESVEEKDPMEWKLPCDIKIGAGTIKAGVHFKTLLLRLQSLDTLWSAMLHKDSKSDEAKALRAALDNIGTITPFNPLNAADNFRSGARLKLPKDNACFFCGQDHGGLACPDTAPTANMSATHPVNAGLSIKDAPPEIDKIIQENMGQLLDGPVVNAGLGVEGWLIEDYDANNKPINSIVLGPLTDDVYLPDTAEAHALCKVESALSAVEQYKADAERLQFLIDNELQVWEVSGTYWVREVTEAHTDLLGRRSAREAIDLAIRARNGKEIEGWQQN